MKTIYTFVILSVLIALSLTSRAQLISRFTWEGATPSTADYGPNATSISSYAVINTDGAAGTHGLNAGAGSHDINMVLPGSYFTISSLDISVDFRRKESEASFFLLGSFDFGMTGGSLRAKFLISKNSHDTLINLSNLYSVPNDNAFHTYRFVYNANTGAATVSVDGTTVGSYQAPASTSLSWTGAGNLTVGSLMDGTSNNVSILDNFVVKNPIGFATLPLELLSFDAANADRVNKLSWTTANENGTREFVIERSVDGVNYSAIGSVAAESQYSFTDMLPASVNYYRLKMVDQDNSFTYSGVKKVTGTAATATVTCYPNPVVNTINVRVNGTDAAQYVLATIDGRVLQAGMIANGQGSLNVSNAPHGMLVVRVENETFKILKQ